MKKLLILSLVAVAGFSQAREVESYEVKAGSKLTRPQLCTELAKEASKNYEAGRTNDRISRWGACDCVTKPATDREAGLQCRLTYFYETDMPKGDGKTVIKSIVIPKFND